MIFHINFEYAILDSSHHPFNMNNVQHNGLLSYCQVHSENYPPGFALIVTVRSQPSACFAIACETGCFKVRLVTETNHPGKFVLAVGALSLQAGKIRESVYRILRQEQQEQQPHRKQDMER